MYYICYVQDLVVPTLKMFYEEFYVCVLYTV